MDSKKKIGLPVTLITDSPILYYAATFLDFAVSATATE